MALPQFKTTATTKEGVLRDAFSWYTQKRRMEGTIPPSVGVTEPLPQNIQSAEVINDYGRSWTDTMRRRKGTMAYDNMNTSPSDSYRKRRYEFLKESEGVRFTAYDDATGNTISSSYKPRGKVTVGIGFNMDAPGARGIWKAVIGDEADFDEVYSGRKRLNEDQVRRLFDATIQDAEEVVQRKLGDVSLDENQRLALVSLAFNLPALIGPNLTRHVKNGDMKSAAEEILYRSNAKKIKGLAARRYREASMFVGAQQASAVVPDYKDYISQFSSA